MELLYGSDGEGIYDYPEICAKHFYEYSQVSLLFIRTDGIYITDENGDYLYDADGIPAIREMTEEEYAERINLSRELIERMNSGDISVDEFTALLEKNDGDGKYWLDKYYFHPESRVTAEYAKEYAEIVATAITMNEGELRRVTLNNAFCFIYKHTPSKDSYDVDNPFLADFAMNAAPHQYEQFVTPFLGAVKFNKNFDSYSPLSIPEINDFYVRSMKQNTTSKEEKVSSAD
jgi:hypothetical protein